MYPSFEKIKVMNVVIKKNKVIPVVGQLSFIDPKLAQTHQAIYWLTSPGLSSRSVDQRQNSLMMYFLLYIVPEILTFT